MPPAGPVGRPRSLGTRPRKRPVVQLEESLAGRLPLARVLAAIGAAMELRRRSGSKGKWRLGEGAYSAELTGVLRREVCLNRLPKGEGVVRDSG